MDATFNMAEVMSRTILNASSIYASCDISTLILASEIIGTIFMAFNKAIPDKLLAGYGTYLGQLFYGTDPRNGRYYIGFTFCSLASGGAMKGIDGKPYMSPMSN